MKTLIILIPLLFLSACSFEDLIDKRGQSGCYVTGATTDGVLTVEANRTAAWCSQELPDSFKFSYDDGRTKVSIGE